MKRSVLLVALLCAGCSCPVKTVYVPVSSCQSPPEIAVPELAVDRLPVHPDTVTGLRALMDDHIAMRSLLNQCVTALDAYKPVKATE